MADKKMDISSLSDAQQEQLHGLQEKFTEHLAQRQQHQEHEQKQKQPQHEQNIYQQPQIQHHSYDPSQVQVYDATHAYYHHHQQHYEIPATKNAYNQSGFPISYQQQMVRHESVPVHPVQLVQPEQPVGVSVSQNGTSQAVEGSGGEAQLQPQQNVYNPQNLSAQQQRQVTAAALAAIAANPALDPNAAEAVSALAQLTQYAGTMGAAERATAAMQLQQLLGSGEGFGPMMAQFFGPNPLVGQPPFIGGRGGQRRGKRRFSSDSSPSKAPQPDPSAGDKLEVSEQKEPSVAEAEAETVPSASAPDSVMIGPQPGPSRVIWLCDLCNADCNSAEILEQHQNGKKHKKNMQKTGVTISVKPESQQVDKVEQPADSAQPSEEKSIAGAKRKMTSGTRTCEPLKPKVVIPVMCDLCNIKCDSQQTFNRHLAGKKHLSKVKRYEGHQVVYGPNAQALYPPNPSAQQRYEGHQAVYGPNAQALYPPNPSAQQPYYHPQVPQPFYGTQSLYPPYDQYMLPQAHDPAAAAPTGYYHP